MSFGKSRARMLSRDKNKVTFKEVAGMAEAKMRLRSHTIPQGPQEVQRLGGRIRKAS